MIKSFDNFINEHERTGDCFTSSYEFMMSDCGRNKALKLVHGYVTGQGPLEGERFSHGWCEDNEYVYDYSNNRQIKFPIDSYYQLGNIIREECKYYTFLETIEKGIEYKFRGPWEINL